MTTLGIYAVVEVCGRWTAFIVCVTNNFLPTKLGVRGWVWATVKNLRIKKTIAIYKHPLKGDLVSQTQAYDLLIPNKTTPPSSIPYMYRVGHRHHATGTKNSITNTTYMFTHHVYQSVMTFNKNDSTAISMHATAMFNTLSTGRYVYMQIA